MTANLPERSGYLPIEGVPTLIIERTTRLANLKMVRAIFALDVQDSPDRWFGSLMSKRQFK